MANSNYQKIKKLLLVSSSLCAVATAVMLYVPKQFPLQALGISAAIFGLVMGLIIRKSPEVTKRSFFILWGISAATYFAIAMLIEIVKYQPWHQLPLDGHLVNLFALRAVYNSPLVIWYAVVSLIAAIIPVVLSRHIWKNFHLGRNM